MLSERMIIGKRIDPDGKVSDVIGSPDPLDSVFNVTADVAESWHVAVRDALATALPAAAETVVFVCLPETCGPHNVYGDAVCSRLNLPGLVTHGPVWVVQMDDKEDDGLFFGPLSEDVSGVIADTVGRVPHVATLAG